MGDIEIEYWGFVRVHTQRSGLYCVNSYNPLQGFFGLTRI
jgi:hypothetical protein